MVALFVLLMFAIFILIDFINMKRKVLDPKKDDVMLNLPEIGFTMADGGKKIEEEKKNL